MVLAITGVAAALYAFSLLDTVLTARVMRLNLFIVGRADS